MEGLICDLLPVVCETVHDPIPTLTAGVRFCKLDKAVMIATLDDNEMG